MWNHSRLYLINIKVIFTHLIKVKSLILRQIKQSMTHGVVLFIQEKEITCEITFNIFWTHQLKIQWKIVYKDHIRRSISNISWTLVRNKRIIHWKFNDGWKSICQVYKRKGTLKKSTTTCKHIFEFISSTRNSKSFKNFQASKAPQILKLSKTKKDSHFFF